MSEETEILETEEYPLATDHLQKGSVVSVATIERAFSVRYGETRYQFAAMRAVDHIKRRLRERGLEAHIVQDGGAIRILTDEESHAYYRNEVAQSFGRITRLHRTQLRQDRALMSDETRDQHDRDCEVVGRQISAWRKEAKMPALAPNQRQTPVLAEVKGEKK